MDPKIVILELNEVPYQVIDDFIARHPQSNWARLSKSAARYETITPDTGYLHPKTSWQTFHRGVADNQHGIYEYNQDCSEISQKYPTFLEMLRDAGKKIGCGASIGSYPLPEGTDNIGFYLPDPFAPGYETIPPSLEAFQKFNNLAVAGSGRVVRNELPLAAAINFVVNIPRLGISFSTLWKTAKQLVSERLDKKKIIRRRTVQSLLTFDVCLKQIEKSAPAITTLFSNHVASSMHRYWAATFEDDYEENKMPLSWRRDYGSEIDFAMQEADYMLGRLEQYSAKNPGTKIMVLGSMGQHGIEHEVTHNQLIISDFDRFMAAVELRPQDYEALVGMEPEYVLRFADAQNCERFVENFKALQIGDQIPEFKRLNDNQVRFEIAQTNISEAVPVHYKQQASSLEEFGIKIQPIQDLAGSTAQHVPEGALLVFGANEDKSSLSDTEQICLTSVTASILSTFGLQVPDYMSKPQQSLVQALS